LTIAEQRPVCAFCTEVAVKYRTADNPAYGFGPSGLPRTYREFLDWLTDQPAVPDEVYGTCLAHEDYVWADGQPTLTAAGQSKLKRKEVKRPRLPFVQARPAAINLMGGVCEVCRETDRLRIVPPDRLREQLGLTGPAGWLNRVIEDEGVRKECRLLCLGCHQASLPNQDPKEGALEAYGKQCEICEETNPDQLWIVPAPGTLAPRTSGGRKMNSRDKVAYLARQGFPPGWRVRCPEHAHTP
jgi:hypothetical protein